VKPLAGVRIVSIEQFGAAPYGTMFLADLGADVIKIENLAVGGDPARRTGPFLLGDADSDDFQTCNMTKKSVALDRRSGRELRRVEGIARPRGLAVADRTGEVWVAAIASAQVVRVASDGTVLGRTGGFGAPFDVRIDPGPRALP